MWSEAEDAHNQYVHKTSHDNHMTDIEVSANVLRSDLGYDEQVLDHDFQKKGRVCHLQHGLKVVSNELRKQNTNIVKRTPQRH